MSIFENFPYTNFHELNLDYILKRVKELEGEVADLTALLESGPVVDVKANVGGSWVSQKDGSGNVNLPAGTHSTIGGLKFESTSDTEEPYIALSNGGGWEKVPALDANDKIDPSLYDVNVTFPVTDVKSYDNGSWVSCVNGSGVAQIPKADPDSYGTVELETTGDRNDRAVKISGLQYSDYLPALQDVNGTFKVDASVIPDSGVTAGTYGSSTPITAAWNNIPTAVAVGDDGRVTAIASDTIPHVRCISSSIAAGSTSVSFYCDSTYGPTYNGTQWAIVRAYTLSTDMGSTYFNPLIEGTDYTVRYNYTYRQVYVNLTSAMSDTVYVQLIGAYGQSGK